MHKTVGLWPNLYAAHSRANLQPRHSFGLSCSIHLGNERRYETFVSRERRQVVGERERDPPAPAKHIPNLYYWRSCRNPVAVLEDESKRPIAVTVSQQSSPRWVMKRKRRRSSFDKAPPSRVVDPDGGESQCSAGSRRLREFTFRQQFLAVHGGVFGGIRSRLRRRRPRRWP